MSPPPPFDSRVVQSSFGYNVVKLYTNLERHSTHHSGDDISNATDSMAVCESQAKAPREAAVFQSRDHGRSARSTPRKRTDSGY